jgi:dCTP deaminase
MKMTLSDRNIKEYMEDRKLIINKIGKEQIQPASVDLRLGKGFLEIEREQVINGIDEVKYSKLIDDEQAMLLPGDFILATTFEWLELPNNIVGELSGKSSWGRKGLKIENAGFVDPGFKGNLTLEIKNEGPAIIKIEYGQAICQIEFRRLMTPAEKPYNGKYIKQKGTTGARK